MKEIPLTRGMVAIVDDADFAWLNQWKWQAKPGRNTFYAATTMRVNGRRVSVAMHRLIMGVTDPSIFIDHEDNCGLHNWRSNLRACTSAENNRNQIKADGYKGVSWHKRTNMWAARITLNKKTKHLGYYKTPELAAAAYNTAAIQLFSEYARLNDVQPMFLDYEAATALRPTNRSGYNGVATIKDGVWSASIYANGKKMHLGFYRSPEAAAIAYDAAAKKYFTPRRRLNFPNE